MTAAGGARGSGQGFGTGVRLQRQQPRSAAVVGWFTRRRQLFITRALNAHVATSGVSLPSSRQRLGTIRASTTGGKLMTMRHLRAAAAAALACVAITSCSSGHADVTPTPPVVQATATVSPKPSLAPGPAAIAAYSEFSRRELIAWHKRSSAGLNLDAYAQSGSTLDDAERQIRSLVANNQTVSGQPILSPKVVSANNLVVKLSDCVDNTPVTFVDASGKNTKTGPSRVPTKVVVERLSESDPWLVSKISPDFTGTKC